jgi:predicted flap endonuclease-1-like 5' DNA nuclease
VICWGLSGNTGRSTGAHLHFELILPEGDAAFGGRVDPTAYLPGGGTASSLGWMLADIPGISRRQVEALVDAGVLTPEQVAGEAPLPGMTQILSPEELAHWLDVNVFDAGGSDAVSARQGWNLIAGARAMLQTGPKPVKPKKGDGEGVVLGDGSSVGTPLRPGLVPGLTEAMIKTLNEAGITTFEQLAGRDSGMGPTAWMDALTGLPGIGPATAEKLVTGTLEAINSGKLARATEGGPPPAQPGDRPLEAGVVKGVGPATLDKLRAAGITTVEQLRDTAPEWLALNVEGMGETTAGEVVDLATEVAKTPWDGRPNWEGLPYIGAVTEEEMYEKGYTASDALATVSPKRLAYDLGISEERARNAINAYRKANGLPELTEEAEAALEALEGATPDDLEDIDGVGSKLEERLYKGGYSTHASLYELGFDELKRVLAQPDSTTFKVLNALREEQGLPPFTSVAEARGATAAPVGEEPGNLGTAGVSSGQQQLLERQGVKTLKELTEISDADLAKWLGISVSDAQEMKRRAQQDMDARSAAAAGDGAVPEPPLEMSDADPFAVRGPADANMQRAFAALQKLRRGERPERDEAPAAPATVPQDTSMKPDARLNLGDALSTLLDGVERGQQAIRATMVAGVGEAAAGGSDATLATAAKGLGVNMDQLSEELLARLRLTLLKDVFDEFEKVMNS